MRIVLQRVAEAAVDVGDERVGRIGPGLLLLAAVGDDDTPERIAKMAEKCAGLRVFPAEGRAFERSVADEGGAVLAVSQFTLYGDCRTGRRPSLAAAAPPGRAEPLFDLFVEEIRRRGVRVATGRFGAHMRVSLVNEGPVTFLLET